MEKQCKKKTIHRARGKKGKREIEREMGLRMIERETG